jgi:Phosphotransferase enzyme family
VVSAWHGPVFARILVVPASRDGLGPFYQDVIAVSPLEPWDAASAAYRLEILARTLPFPVGGARLVPSNNNDVWRLETGFLRVAWRGDRSRLAREAELLGRLRGFLPVPEVLDCGGDDRLSWSLADGEVLLHGDFYLGNVLVRGDHVTALIDLEFARMGPRDLELISVVRALDAETRLGIRRPPLLAWLAEDYPELFGAADLRGRLWLYALAYTIRQIIFWPPDRAEADDLEVTHPLYTLRRLIDTPPPLLAAGMS